MKKLILLIALISSTALCNQMYSQVTFKVNIVDQPIWGPVGYNHVEYYYIPEVHAYYYVAEHKFIYLENHRWVSRTMLPERYRHYDLYNAHKIVINEPKPYLHHREIMARYVTGHKLKHQQVIRDSHEQRYFIIKQHPEHNKWEKNQKHPEHQVHQKEHSHRDRHN